ncbi:MAG: GNAT family N-acetyltransferase [Bacteroidales bacterium]|nr:GNAT family N-acetyltransferase [Bacteroidales bacterium]
MKKTDNYSIRDYREEDFPGIMELWIKTGLSRPERDDNETIISESIRIGGCLLVLEENATGRICGTSWMTYDGRRIHMHHFGISPESQGKGLAGMLLEKSLEFVRKKGYQVKIEVHRNNHRAVSLYKKAGFEYLGDYDVYIIRNINTPPPPPD